ncbi:MAG: sigma 54-interacting transcriptional regulator [Pseudomonadota bacterium]
MATLTWMTPEKEQKKYCIYKNITTVGTDADNDIVVKSRMVLPHHARIVYDGKQFSVISIEKGATITLKGKKKSKFYLKDSDMISVGGVELKFMVLDPSVVVRPSDDHSSSSVEIGSEIKGLRKLFDFSKTLMEKKSIDEILDSLVDITVDVTGADKGFLIMMDGEKPVIRAARNINQKTIADPVEHLSDSVLQKVIETKRPIIVMDALADAEFKNSESVLSLNLCSLMVTPLLDEGKLTGILYVGNDSIRGRFDQGSLELFTIFGAQASLILNKALVLERFRSNVEELKVSIEMQHFGEIVGSCSGMQEIFRKISKVSTVDVPVLIVGETGTGKELIAREVHARSTRSKGPFVAINCGAIPENLMESEMFGYMKGSFTGATSSREGKFHAANRGTIFLDEIGELPLNLQVKLLRVLQDKEVLRVGATRPEIIDCRILAATNKELEKEMAEARFREDLYYRLNVVTIALPPLRERGEDVVILGKYFLTKYAKEMGRSGMDFSPEAVKGLKKYPWQGNVRELQNRLKKAILMCDSPLLGAEDLDIDVGEKAAIMPLAVAKEEFQKNYILDALKRNQGNRTKTAEELGVDPRTIFRYLEKEKDFEL